ncbi:MAG TPA: ABC transporter ATP-binding protein [Chthoniobacterales bacterium]|jgi:ATP-binding cassette subfamily B protein|nr:ABC transporter ATP-binding protein [Chthoniobacterales bacterium]
MPEKPPPPAPRSLLGDLGVAWARRKTLWKLFGRSEKLGLLSGVVVTVVVAYIQVRIAVLIGDFFNDVLKRSGDATALSEYVTLALALLLGYYVVKESLQLFRRWLITRSTSRIESDMTARLVGHLLRIDLGALAADRIGALHGRITRSVEGFVKFLKVVFADFIPALTLAGAALYTALARDWHVGLVMLGMVPAAVLITIWQVSSQKGVRLELLRAKESLDGTVVEQLGGLEYIRAANTHPLEVARVTAAANARGKREFKHGFAMARFDWLKAVNEAVFCTGILGFSVVLAVHGKISYGDILTFWGLFLTILGPMKEVHRMLDEAYESSMQVTVLLQMLDQPQDQSFNIVTLRPPRLDGSIPLLECQELVVEYKTPQGPRRILDGVTLAIHQGQTIGIAGRSGSGKSTWLRAVLRLLHPTSGEVLVGGVPIGVLSREDIGKSIGYVSQVPFVFAGTVRENIGYGCGAVGLEQIEEAARQAHIHEEITQMPQGYDSVLTERGGNLSGGQRQRLALARMFLKNPPVLILDEGTSALDNISERRVRAAIDHARHSHTVIMVAHRLTTLNETDCIFVFDQGRVVEQGAFDHLVANNGVFAELVRSAEAA